MRNNLVKVTFVAIALFLSQLVMAQVPPYHFIGAVDDNWSNVDNWVDNNFDDFTSNAWVLLNDGSEDVQVHVIAVLTSDASVNTLFVDAGSSLDVGTFTLTTAGDLNSIGDIYGGTGAINVGGVFDVQDGSTTDLSTATYTTAPTGSPAGLAAVTLPAPPVSAPLSNWAIFAVIGLIGATVVIRRRLV